MSENQQEENQNHQLKQNGIIFSINEDETAIVIGCNSRNVKIFIPSCVNSESKKYDVTSIKSVQNLEDSNNRETFQSITIPSSVTDLKEGWCSGTPKLNQVRMSPSNPRYRFIDESMIIGKATNESNNYENLSFCVRNINKVTIPTFIKRIDSFAFAQSFIVHVSIPNSIEFIGKRAFFNCKQLRYIEISKESKLQKIEESAFEGTSIERITIPNEVKIIGKCAFSYCVQLQYVEISEESKLQMIEESAFGSSAINSITIPVSTTDLKEGWYFVTPQLIQVRLNQSNPRYRFIEERMIIGKPSNEPSELNKSDNYENLVFCYQNISTIKIPNYIKRIDSFVFYQSSIADITIPGEVRIIGKNSFSFCRQLRRIEISKESKLQTIGESAFNYSGIEYIRIPSSVTNIGKYAFCSCKQLRRIEISKESKLQKIEESIFEGTLIESITIPNEFKVI